MLMKIVPIIPIFFKYCPFPTAYPASLHLRVSLARVIYENHSLSLALSLSHFINYTVYAHCRMITLILLWVDLQMTFLKQLSRLFWWGIGIWKCYKWERDRGCGLFYCFIVTRSWVRVVYGVAISYAVVDRSWFLFSSKVFPVNQARYLSSVCIYASQFSCF